MRTFLPDRSDHEVDVHAHYAAGWSEIGGLRVNFVAAADGAAQASGTSRGLQTSGDNVVFAALRDLADVVLVASGTAVAEKYGPATPGAQRQARRRDHGYAAALPVAVSSRSLHLDPGDRLFVDADPAARTILLTCESADAGRRRALAEVADVVICGGDTVEPALIRAALTERGHRRILSEGGPTAFAQLVSGGVVDELCLSLSPMLAGPGAGRITAGDQQWPEPAGLGLVGLLEDDGALFLRYSLARG